MSNNLQRLGETLNKRMQKTAQSAVGIVVELGIINANMSMTPDSLQVAIPNGDYMISAGQDPHPGERVLVAWCGNEPVVIAAASAEAAPIRVDSDGNGHVTISL